MNASTKDAEDEAQKSTALRLERPKKSLWRTFLSRSSSRFSCRSTSWTIGVSSRHLSRVWEVRFCTSEFACRLRPSPTEVSWERSNLLTKLPNQGWLETWSENLAKVAEWRIVTWEYSVLIVAAWIVLEVKRQEMRSSFRGA